MLGKGLVKLRRVRRLFLHHGYSRLFQFGESFSGHFGVGVLDRHMDLPDAGGDDCSGTGCRAPKMAAGFQGGVQRSAASAVTGLLQRADFSVSLAWRQGVPLTNYRAIFDHHRSHRRVGAGAAQCLSGQGDGTLHGRHGRRRQAVVLGAGNVAVQVKADAFSSA